MLTEEQKRFFETFGYLVLPGLVKEEIDWITEEFEAVFSDRGVQHDGSKRSTVVPFIDQRRRLCTLLDHPKIEGLIGSLLGDEVCLEFLAILFQHFGVALEEFIDRGLARRQPWPATVCSNRRDQRGVRSGRLGRRFPGRLNHMPYSPVIVPVVVLREY